MERAITISLIITAIHVSMWEGMIFSFVRVWLSNIIDDILTPNAALKVKKPLFECLICMGGIWTLILCPIIYQWELNIIITMLEVIGINTIISGLINRLYD